MFSDSKLSFSPANPRNKSQKIFLYKQLQTVLSFRVCVCVCVCVVSQVQLVVTPWTVNSSVHGNFQASILEWVATFHSRRSSWPRGWTHVSWVSCIGRWILDHCTTGKPYPSILIAKATDCLSTTFILYLNFLEYHLCHITLLFKTTTDLYIYMLS